MASNVSPLKSFLLDCTPPIALRTYHAMKKPRNVPPNPLELSHRELNKSSAFNEIVMRKGLKLKICPESRVPFEHFCFRDAEMADEMDEFLRLGQGKSRLLDVGALHGVFSLAFVMQDASRKALALEPSPMASPFLLYNIRANAPDQITYVESALGDRNENIRMAFEWQHLVALGANDHSIPAQNVAEIRCQRGDDVCLNQKFEPDFIKMDVEGFEHPCLIGLRNTLEKLRPLICLEIHPRMPDGHTAGQLAAYMTGLGYQFYDLNGAKMSNEQVTKLEKVTRVVVKPD